MGLLFRAIVWFGMYLAVALLPLTLAFVLGPPASAARSWWQEFVAATGFVGLALLTLEFTLVSRLRAASEPFGTDALVHFHRWMGFAAVAIVVAHALALIPQLGIEEARALAGTSQAGIEGALALFAALLLVATSVARRRLRLSYERWQWLHAFLAFAIIGLGLAHATRIEAYSAAPSMRWTLVGYALLAGLIWVWHRIVRPLRLMREPWTITENRDIGGDTRLLRVKPVGHDGLPFVPGQFVWLMTGKRAITSEQHPITIASSAERRAGDELELAIKAFGDWSSEVVPRLQTGARVWLDGAYGALTPDRYPAQGFVLIAGGLGITPMRSILLTMRDRGDVRPVILIYAANRPERMVFREELEALTREMSLTLVPVFEDPPIGWAGERGLVTAELLRRHLPARLERWVFFICGPAPMMDALENDLLLRLRVSPSQIATERFNEV
jgi:predicted ferric reductase